ncbi:DUF1830 domain-containing protein [Phormidium sp. CCY1219]|uniref:DUF1830 domain-containing protein n=1 Tax=Phormidium sp. CCY1219 TaxID=2886104 RepID=UPI002D1F76FA|nr:DUF1830 domain-containing protein [Phormidium sp. CCY1219]MEB3826499.1 DUF1830 domain-containing protein [Phormidium sp. CCY1219]
MLQTLLNSKNASDNSDLRRILCFYFNQSDRIVLLKSKNFPSKHFERVVFPNQRFMFEAVPHADLEVHIGDSGGWTVTEVIPCDRLQVKEG